MKEINAQKFGEKRQPGQTRWYKVIWWRNTAVEFRHEIKHARNAGAFGQSESQKIYNAKLRKSAL